MNVVSSHVQMKSHPRGYDDVKPLILLLSRSIKLWNAVHIMSIIGRIT